MAVGVNVTVIVQSQPALRLVPQVDFALKSPGSVPPSVMLLIASDVLWSLVRITVSAFFAAHRDRSILHVERRNAHRLRAVEHDGNEAGNEGADVDERDIRHAVAVEVGNCGADGSPARVKTLRTGEGAIAVALEYGRACGIAVAGCVGNDYIELSVPVEIGHNRNLRAAE